MDLGGKTILLQQLRFNKTRQGFRKGLIFEESETTGIGKKSELREGKGNWGKKKSRELTREGEGSRIKLFQPQATIWKKRRPGKKKWGSIGGLTPEGYLCDSYKNG